MIKISLKLKKIDTAFTLIELLIVIIIIGILTGLALPDYMKMKRSSYSAEAWSNLTYIMKAAKADYLQKNGSAWTTNISLLNIDNPNSNSRKKYDYMIVDNTGGNIYFIALPITTSWNAYAIRCANCALESESSVRWQCDGDGVTNCVTVGS